MLTDVVRDYYRYCVWANDRVLDQAEHLTDDQLFEPVLDEVWPVHNTLVHMLAGQDVWLRRWTGEPGATLETEITIGNMRSLSRQWQKLNQQTFAFLDTLTDERLSTPGLYRNYRGERMTSPLWKQMFHQCNHQTYHRGEVAALLSHLGHSPGEIDYSRYFVLESS